MCRKKAFTLVELLVVIAIIALLMAILMPVLGRIKRQARAVVCRSNLRQCGLWFSMYTQENDDKFFGGLHHRTGLPHRGSVWTVVMRPYYKDANDVLLCPMAARLDPAYAYPALGYKGSTFSAWEDWPSYYTFAVRGSYGLNYHVRNDPDLVPGAAQYWHQPCWRTTLTKGAENIPVFLDCSDVRVKRATMFPAFAPPIQLMNDWHPPVHEGWIGRGGSGIRRYCINRHSGGINGLFMDWSVRKVGLKELWTLKWDQDFDTANGWTKAGGVKPEDWPEWMRGFKDY